MNTEELRILQNQINIPLGPMTKALELFAEGATIPFIARYRKEVTQGLDEVQLADLKKEWAGLEELIKRKAFVLTTIGDQGKLNDQLKSKIEACWNATLLEDLYLPYKQKRKTRGMKAKDLGLEPLAKVLFEQREKDIGQICQAYINDDVPNESTALAGARDIISEWIAEDGALRGQVRSAFEKYAIIESKVGRGKKEEAVKYKDYYEFDESLKRCPSHRLLAMFRGEQEGMLRLNIGPDPERTVGDLARSVCKGFGPATDQVREALEEGYDRLLKPSIENEFRKIAKEKADLEAIDVFTNNLRQLLLSAPLGEKTVLGIDPGFRTGCKVVVINAQGALLHNDTIFPHPPQNRKRSAEEKILQAIHEYKVQAIAIGNGTAGRESMDFCSSIRLPEEVECFMVNEAGASIYSASDIARDEFPDKDITVRGAVSIARRLMDPLAELVKIDAKSIGVGQYQHDVNQTMLRDSLDRTVESCVNAVGINLNTASKHLLAYVSGLGPTLANNIVEYRNEIGTFTARTQLKKVPRLGAKAYEQCAGFLRIRNANNPLDNTAVHPERYDLVKTMAKDQQTNVDELIQKIDLQKNIKLSNYVSNEVGMPTLQDIIKELAKPGLDPRGAAKSFSFDRSIKTMEDLEIGMRLPGIVTNITNFGAFVDVGVKQDGLVHISQLADTFVKNPADHVKLNQEVQVRVVEVDIDRKRIQLSMKTN